MHTTHFIVTKGGGTAIDEDLLNAGAGLGGHRLDSSRAIRALRRAKARVALLVAFYIVLVLFSWLALLVVGLGLIDQWAGFRQRLHAPGGKQEED